MRLPLKAASFALLTLPFLFGCPGKQEEKGTPDKAAAEVERAEPDDDAKAADEKKKADKPAAAAPAEKAAEPEKKEEEGGW